MTRLELFQILRPIVESVTGLTNAVILADQTIVLPDGSVVGAPAPVGPYAAIEPKQRVGERGQANIYNKTSTTPQSVDVDVRAQIMVDASVNFYRGDDPMGLASKLKQCNKKPTISAALFQAGLGWFGTEAVNDLSTLISGNIERRAQITLHLAYEATDSETINSIEFAGYEVQREDGTVMASGEIPPLMTEQL